MDYTIIKDAATKIVANIKAMEDDITVLRNKQDIISTSDTTMTGSYPGRLSIEEISGQCEQFTTTGKNLIETPYSTVSKIVEGITYTVNGNGTISAKGTATGNADFILKGGTNATASILFNGGTRLVGCPSGGSASTYFLRASDNVNYAATDFGQGINITSDIRQIYIRVLSGATVDVVFKPMITTDLEATYDDYEPYTGGQPSPNPDYPQEIKNSVVKGIKTHTKNLLDFKKLTNNLASNVNATYTKSEDKIVITTEANYHSGIYSYLALLDVKNGLSTLSFDVTISSGTKIYLGFCENQKAYSITPNVKTKISATAFANGSSLCIYSGEEVAKTITIENIQIEYGEVATDYVPFAESTITFSQPIELYGIGDVQDTIEDGKVKRKIGKAVFDGSADEYWYSENNYFRMQGVNTDNTVPILCKHLRQTKIYEEINSVSGTMWVIVNGFSINMTGVCSTVSELRTWLADNQLTIFYGLPTEAIEPLPTVDQIALNSLKTYDGITYVEIESHVEPTAKFEYGITKNGGYILEGMLAGVNGVSLGQSNTDRITALEATLVNNI